ncbi:unnamed protein product [Phytophthora fragariaefolia]|uniref:Unnamed protein product n=1 Tax=Phytophthora fragariaefolia TaxID=1490495 RepID=A0A9W6XTG5_9STRA|nr:unnamed protein product [Phytophthora fragariaefolia]
MARSPAAPPRSPAAPPRLSTAPSQSTPVRPARCGRHVELRYQPANSPDLNVLDLGLFCAIQARQRKKIARTLDELIETITESNWELPARTINAAFLRLQDSMDQCIQQRGDNAYNPRHMKKAKLEREGRLPLSIRCSDEAAVYLAEPAILLLISLYLDLTILTRLIRPTTDYQHVRMEYEHGAENLPVDTNMSTGSPNAASTHGAREDCPHLADPEWEALQRLATVIGEAAVATMLRTLSPTEQHGVALGFIMKEQREIAARATASTPSTTQVESLKHHVNSYVVREGEPLLRCLVEVDTAITARRIVDPLSKVAFAMSCRGGRARSWAYGRRLTDRTCSSTYEVFKEEIRQAFEPPQNEFRSRAKFLDLQQGEHDVHAYAQRARYLVSNIVTNPVDEATKVVTFMKVLKDGPVKTYLFREYPAKKLKQPAGAGPPAGDAVERVDIGHAVSKTAAPSESHSHCKMKDDKPNLVILTANSLDFEEVELPRSLLEVRLATGVVVRNEKRVVRACFSYEEKKFVDELIVLDLDDKFDMVLGMPWLVRHDPVIDWVKRSIVRFRSSGATESDGPVCAAHVPRGTCDPPAEAARGAAASDPFARTLTTERVVRETCEPNQKTQIRSDLRV